MEKPTYTVVSNLDFTPACYMRKNCKLDVIAVQELDCDSVEYNSDLLIVHDFNLPYSNYDIVRRLSEVPIEGLKILITGRQPVIEESESNYAVIFSTHSEEDCLAFTVSLIESIEYQGVVAMDYSDLVRLFSIVSCKFQQLKFSSQSCVDMFKLREMTLLDFSEARSAIITIKCGLPFTLATFNLVNDFFEPLLPPQAELLTSHKYNYDNMDSQGVTISLFVNK